MQTETVLVDGDPVEVSLEGTGTPSVIFEGGGLGKASDWRKVQPLIAEHCASLAYTRPIARDETGSSRAISDRAGKPSPYASVARSTKCALGVLKAVNLRPPYILAGHSLGGFYIRFLAEELMSEAIGLVFVEARSPRWISTLGRLMNSSLPESKRESQTLLELEHVRHVYQAADGTGPFPNIPISVISADPTRLLAEFQTRGFDNESAALAVAEIERGHEELRDLSPFSSLTQITGAGHALPLEAPQAVAKCILDLAVLGSDGSEKPVGQE